MIPHLDNRAFLRALAILLFVSSAVFPSLGAAADRTVFKMKQSGVERSYIVHMPSNLGAKSSWPVLFAFHPFGSTAEEFEAATRLHAAKGSENFIVVYPNGFRRSWNVGACCGRASKRRIDDIGFFNAIMADLKKRAPIRDRAYLTGFSNGTMFVYYLICRQADSVAAAAPAGATIKMDSKTCKPSRSVPILHIHGEVDTWAPLKGGKSSFKFVASQPPVRKGLEYLANRNGCSKKSSKTLTRDVGCDVWSGCSRGADVSLCVVPKLGHLWPGRSGVELRGKMDLGPARTDIGGTSAIVQFFLRH